MNKIKDFIAIYRLYSHHNPRLYAARIAFGCAFRDLPF